MLVSGETQAVTQLERSADELGSRLGLRVLTKATTSQQAPRDFLPYQIRVTGVDRPGIVQRVAAVLAGRGVNNGFARVHARPTRSIERHPDVHFGSHDYPIPSALALADLRREAVQLRVTKKTGILR